MLRVLEGTSGARLFPRFRSWIKCWTASWKGSEESPERASSCCSALPASLPSAGQHLSLVQLCNSGTTGFNCKTKLQLEVLLLNHRRRGHRGSESSVPWLGSSECHPRQRRKAECRQEPAREHRSQGCLHSAVTLIGHNGDARLHHMQGPDPRLLFTGHCLCSESFNIKRL